MSGRVWWVFCMLAMSTLVAPIAAGKNAKSRRTDKDKDKDKSSVIADGRRLLLYRPERANGLPEVVYTSQHKTPKMPDAPVFKISSTGTLEGKQIMIDRPAVRVDP